MDTGMKKTLIIFILSLLIGTVLLECGLRCFASINDPLLEEKYVGPGMRYIESQFYPFESYLFYPEAELRHMMDTIRFTTNNMGFRGPDLDMPKPPDEYRIFMVGGSTTECLYLDDRRTISAELELQLNTIYQDYSKIRIYNAGKGGDKTFDHIAMIGQRIVHLQPDMIILCCGLNDLLGAIADVDYTHQPQTRRMRCSFWDILAQLATEFQIVRQTCCLFSSESRSDVRQAIPFHSNYKNLAGLCKSYPLSREAPPRDLAAYEINLRTIIGIARSQNIKLMMLTQATTWNSRIDPGTADWHWMNCSDSVCYREKDMDQAMEAYNGVTRRLAREYNIPMQDLAKILPKTLDVIYDDCHLNVNGARLAAQFITQKISNDMLISASADMADR
jgi:lysophospholipase L1-like esterase